MAKWKLPEGRKPLTTMESADLVLRMHNKLAAGFTAGDRISQLEELYEAAKQDAKEAEAYAEELEAKLEMAVEALEWCATVHVSLRARATLIALKGQDDE